MAEFSLGDAVINITGKIAPGLNKALGDADAAVRKNFGNILEATKRIGYAMTAAGGAITGAMGLAARAAGDLDLAMTEALSIMGAVSDETREKMRALALAMSGESRFSAAELAKAYYFLASAGMNAEQAMGALPKVMQFATAGAFGLEQATELLADAQTALGLRSADAAENMANMRRVSDVLVEAANRSNASVQQFAEALTNNAAAAMRILNMDVESGVAVLSVFADQGIKGAEAGTAFGIVLRDLQTKFIEAKQKGGDAAKVYETLGIQVFDATGKFAGMGEVIGQIERALEGMSDEQKKATLGMLGFTDRSVQYIQALIGTSQAIKDYEAGLRAAGGTTEEVARRQMAAFNNQMAALRNRVVNAAIEVGTQLLPTIQRFANEALIPAIDFVGKFAREHEELVLTIAKMGAALAVGGPVLVGIGMLTESIKAAALATNVLMAGGGWGIAAGGGLIGVLALLETFRNPTGFDNFLTRFIDGLGSFGRWIDAYYDRLITTIERVKDLLRWIGLLEARPTLGAGSLGRGLDFNLSDQGPGFFVEPASAAAGGATIQQLTINTSAPLDGRAARRFAQELAMELRRARGR